MRRLIMMISMGGLPPYLCPSDAFLDLGTQCLKSSGALAISLLIKAVPRPGFIEWFARSVYGKGAQLAPAPGYVAPPLDGVWATSPSYLLCTMARFHRYRSCLIVRTDRNIGPARSIRRTIIQTAARLRRAVPPGRLCWPYYPQDAQDRPSTSSWGTPAQTARNSPIGAL
jgi:hypothetical protein